MKSFKQHQQHKAKKAARRSAKETIKHHVRGTENDSHEVANLKYVPASAEHHHEPAHHDDWLASDHCW